jgi:hypothetical protein
MAGMPITPRAAVASAGLPLYMTRNSGLGGGRAKPGLFCRVLISSNKKG